MNKFEVIENQTKGLTKDTDTNARNSAEILSAIIINQTKILMKINLKISLFY